MIYPVLSQSHHLDLPTASSACGTVVLPGSKSISNRVLLLAALAQGKVQINHLLASDDTRVMLAALRQLGVPVDRVDSLDQSVSVSGQSRFPVHQADLFLGNAGTALRPLTAALAVQGGDYKISGVPRMHERPIADLVNALRSIGARIDYLGSEGFPPLHIKQPTLQVTQPITVRGDVSSQFLTALLLVAPLITSVTQQPLLIKVAGELISKPYIKMSCHLMARFGVEVDHSDSACFIVPVARYISPERITVEGDASSASYFLALGAIAGGPVRVEGVGKDSIQGDIEFARFLETLNIKIQWESHAIIAQGIHAAKGQRLPAFDFDFNHIPDAAMTAAVLALYADGPCTLRNIASWRVKETDRIAAMHQELSKIGASVTSGDDYLQVTPPQQGQWKNAQITTYDDHRMAMCFSLACFGGSAVRILEPHCVSKTYPKYFDDFFGLLGVPHGR